MTDNISNLPEMKKATNDVRVPSDAYFIGELGGEKRYVRFDLNSFVEMESIYGDMDKANEALSKGSMTDIRNILWLGLIWNHMEIDPHTGDVDHYTLSKVAVGSWLTTNNLEEVMTRLMEALNDNVPEDGEGNSAELVNDAAEAVASPEKQTHYVYNKDGTPKKDEQGNLIKEEEKADDPNA